MESFEDIDKEDVDPDAQFHFGACPYCARSEGWVNDDWSYCRIHKVRWCTSEGYNRGGDWLTPKETEVFFRDYRELSQEEIVFTLAQAMRTPEATKTHIDDLQRPYVVAGEYEKEDRP
jgi:hypothetical protein